MAKLALLVKQARPVPPAPRASLATQASLVPSAQAPRDPQVVRVAPREARDPQDRPVKKVSRVTREILDKPVPQEYKGTQDRRVTREIPEVPAPLVTQGKRDRRVIRGRLVARDRLGQLATMVRAGQLDPQDRRELLERRDLSGAVDPQDLQDQRDQRACRVLRDAQARPAYLVRQAMQGLQDRRVPLDRLVGLVRQADRETLALQVSRAEPDPPVPKVSPALRELAGTPVTLVRQELQAIQGLLDRVEKPVLPDLAEALVRPAMMEALARLDRRGTLDLPALQAAQEILVSLDKEVQRATQVLLALRVIPGRSETQVSLAQQEIRDLLVRQARQEILARPD